MIQAMKELEVGEAKLKKICKNLRIDRWSFRKLRSLERLVKDVQQFGRFRWEIDRRETVKKLEDEREQMLRDLNLELDVKTKT